jgi:hypothetical protein
MEETKKNIEPDASDRDIVHSQSIKAGKRIYYLDVKKSRKGELYLAITESKKVVAGDGVTVNFEKFKIFLYKEDFDKFMAGVAQAVAYIRSHQPDDPPEHEIKIDIDF